MTRRRSAKDSRVRARADAVSFPGSTRFARPELTRFAPSLRSLALALVVLLAGLGAYGLARVTPVFAVRTITVEGASSGVAAEVRTALASMGGESLLAIQLDAVEARAEAVPTVAAVSVDRAFPHTLALAVVPELPAAVVRQGADSWLVSRRARIVERLERGARPTLPRIWVTRRTEISLGDMLGGEPAQAVRAVASLRGIRLPEPVVSATANGDGVTMQLRSGRELRLGTASDARLKLLVAARVLPALGPEQVYLDVAVADRPVAGTTLDSQVEVEVKPWTPAPGSG